MLTWYLSEVDDKRIFFKSLLDIGNGYRQNPAAFAAGFLLSAKGGDRMG